MEFIIIDKDWKIKIGSGKEIDKIGEVDSKKQNSKKNMAKIITDYEKYDL